MAWVMMLAAVMASPDVFFVTVDTLRADHLGMYGYERPTSPNLDALAAKSLRFDNCVCEVPLTSPSFGSMLASRYPRSTATTRNGLPMPATVVRRLDGTMEVVQSSTYADFVRSL